MRGSSGVSARGSLRLRSRNLLLTDFISAETERSSVSAHFRLYAVMLLNIMRGIPFPSDACAGSTVMKFSHIYSYYNIFLIACQDARVKAAEENVKLRLTISRRLTIFKKNA